MIYVSVDGVLNAGGLLKRIGKNIHIDDVTPDISFDVTKDEELHDAFNWKNMQPILKIEFPRRGRKFILLDSRLQLIKAYQFNKLNEEKSDLIKIFIDDGYST